VIVNASTYIYTAQVNLYPRWTVVWSRWSLDIWASPVPAMEINAYRRGYLRWKNALPKFCPQRTRGFCI